jgi:hypothetical protein
MLTKPVFALLGLTLFALMVGACSDPEANQNNTGPNLNSNTAAAELNDPELPHRKASDNAEELGMLVKLPSEPIEVAWREDAEGGTTKLTAVMRYEKDVADQIEQRASKIGSGEPAEFAIQPWFPNELAAPGELTLEAMVNGTRLPADEFIQPPFTRGTITRVQETDYFILELYR